MHQVLKSKSPRLMGVALALAGGLCGSASAATYYVATTGNDASTGSPSSPWRSLLKAARTMAAGDTTLVAAGTYNESTSSVRSGTAGNPIVFRAQGRVVTKTFNIDHDHVTVDGFEMTGANDGYMMTLRGSYCQIVNNVIHDTGASWGVVRMDSDTMTGCLIKNNRYYSSTGPGDDLTVFVVGGVNNVVEGNEIGPAKDIDAFRAWGTGNVIRGNYIHDASPSPGSAAHLDVIQTFGLNGGISRNIVFEKNRIVNFDGQICMTENNGSAGVRDWDVRDNVYINVGLQANVGMPGFRFYNNTLYNVGAVNRLVMYLYDAPGKSDFSSAKIFNNVFVTSAGISGYGNVMSVGKTGSNVVIGNNYVGSINGYGALSGSHESGGINGGDPKFVNAAGSDFHLQSGSPLIDRGMAVALSQDFEGQARPQGAAVDIGAFEAGTGGSVRAAPAAPTNLTVR